MYLCTSSFSAQEPSLCFSHRIFFFSALLHVCKCKSFISLASSIFFFSSFPRTDFVFWGLTNNVAVTVRDHLTAQHSQCSHQLTSSGAAHKQLSTLQPSVVKDCIPLLFSKPLKPTTHCYKPITV